MLPKLPEFPWYQRDPSMEDVAEYGRQCWNAAIEAALKAIDDTTTFADGDVYADAAFAVAVLKLDSNTVSQEP